MPRSNDKAALIVAPKPDAQVWLARTMPTMDDVARLSGFSQMTVTRAFLDSASIRAETRERILKSLPIPLIEVGNLPKQPIHFAVGHSDFDAGYLATRRLIDGGRRRIAIICGYVRHTSNARNRLAGYRRALREGGLDFVPARIAEVDHAVEAGLAGLARLIASAGPFDGLVVAGEIWTSATLLALLKQGWRIPKDLA